MKGLIVIVVLGMLIDMLTLNGMTRLRQHLASTLSRPTLKNVHPSLLPITSLNTLPISLQITPAMKKVFPDTAQQEVLSNAFSDAYETLQDQLPFSISSSNLSLIALSAIVGLPLTLIDFNAVYRRLKKVALATGIMKKVAFIATYPKNAQGVVLPEKDELLEQLKDLANLSVAQKTFMKESQAYEAEHGEKVQANAWAFGYLLRAAIEKVTNFDDIVLLYQSAYYWLLLRVESGLKNTVVDLNAEFDRIAQQEAEVLNLYDEKSIPVVKKYWQDLRDDLRSRFEKELEMRQKDILNK